MQIHGLAYDDMVSVRLNENAWLPLNNKGVNVAEPAKSYGGIGGGFATLQLTLPLPAGCLLDRANRIHFRFNRTNGVVSGFRVLAFHFVTAEGREILPANGFIEDDPNSWTAPLPDAANIAAGKSLWQGAALTANGLPGAGAIRAHCGDCHTQDGRDLKYFNFSNASIIARSRFHGLSELQGQQIASYIRSLAVENPGRPWNPPYQPGPGLAALPVAQWAAGAGLHWVLANDADTLPFLFHGKVSPAVFRPDGNLSPREIPIAMQLPDWNHWLPRVHPLDSWGERFAGSAFAQLYANAEYAKVADEEKGRAAFFERWNQARSKFLTPHLAPGSKKWSAELAEEFYSAQLWELVKTWELTQSRAWDNTVPASSAPSALNIPDSPAGMGGSALTNEYFSSAWYQVQVVLNSGQHRHRGRTPLDWPYLIGHFRDLERLSGRPEPARLLVTVIKALQSTDPAIGPGNMAEGWRPEQMVDPRIMVDADWAATFAPLPSDLRQAITQALLTAWLDKTSQYPPAAYFQLGLSASSYAPPAADLRNISGGKAWDASARFRAAGVEPQVVQRLQAWGAAYTALAGLFHY